MADFDEHVRSGLDLGGDHWAHREYRLTDGSLVGYPRDAEIPDGALFVGIHERHRSTKDPARWCGGWLGFANVADPVDDHHSRNSKHTLVQADPLTISPSLGCRSCDSHGFIENGRWRDV